MIKRPECADDEEQAEYEISPSARTGAVIGTEPSKCSDADRSRPSPLRGRPRRRATKRKQPADARSDTGNGNNEAGRSAELNKQDLQRAILQAAADAGAEFGESGLVSYLQRQALNAPSPFLTLLGKVLANAPSAPALMPVRLIELVPAKADKPAEDSEQEKADSEL